MQLVVSGLAVGAVYALIALGFVTIYSVTRIINFAQGDLAMIGAMTAGWMVMNGWSPALAYPGGVLAAIMVGGISYRSVLASLSGKSEVTPIILTIGLSIVLQGLALLTFGSEPYTLPAFSQTETVRFAGAALPTQSLWIFGVTLVVVVLLFLFFEKTYLGLTLRAAMVNHFATQLVGLKPTQQGLLSFCLSAGLSAVAGITVTPMTLATYDMGLMLGMKGFSAAVIGGLTNPVGAVFGGLILGVLEALGAGIVSSSYKDALAFALLIAILLVRPRGLFAGQAAERV